MKGSGLASCGIKRALVRLETLHAEQPRPPPILSFTVSALPAVPAARVGNDIRGGTLSPTTDVDHPTLALAEPVRIEWHGADHIVLAHSLVVAPGPGIEPEHHFQELAPSLRIIAGAPGR